MKISIIHQHICFWEVLCESKLERWQQNAVIQALPLFVCTPLYANQPDINTCEDPGKDNQAIDVRTFTNKQGYY